KDAALIRQHMESVEQSYGRKHRYDADPLKGYVLLKPKEAWAFVGALLRNPGRPFVDRYNALLTARYLHDHQQKLIGKREVHQLFADVLYQDDLADFVIEDFRKWQYWDNTDRVLALFGSKSHDQPIVKNAILRYALHCPDPAC